MAKQHTQVALIEISPRHRLQPGTGFAELPHSFLGDGVAEGVDIHQVLAVSSWGTGGVGWVSSWATGGVGWVRGRRICWGTGGVGWVRGEGGGGYYTGTSGRQAG